MKNDIPVTKEEAVAISAIINRVHATAKEKGWWDKEVNALEKHMLMVTEIAEASEAARLAKPHFVFEDQKPEGEAVELVDAVIRIFDYFGYKNWNFAEILEAKMSYNQSRPYRHGNKLY